MKNKKFLTIIAAVVISGVLLTAGAMAANPAGSAYEQFKLLLDEKHGIMENATAEMSIAVVDNGEAVIALDGSMKMDESSKKMSGSFVATINEKVTSIETFRNNDDVLLHLTGSDNWYKTTRQDEDFEEDNSQRRFGRDRSERFDDNKQLRDALLDTIMGDYKEQVSMTEANGLRTFSLSFEEGNMPILLQTMFQVSEMGEKRDECVEPEVLSALPQELQDAFADMKNRECDVELVDKKLRKLAISFTVDQKNQPVVMAISINCSGTDIEGAAHDLDIDFSMSLSNIGTTVVDEANPDSASVTTIDSEILMGHGRRLGVRGN